MCLLNYFHFQPNRFGMARVEPLFSDIIVMYDIKVIYGSRSCDTHCGIEVVFDSTPLIKIIYTQFFKKQATTDMTTISWVIIQGDVFE